MIKNYTKRYVKQDWKQQLLKIAEGQLEYEQFINALREMGLAYPQYQQQQQAYPQQYLGQQSYSHSLSSVSDIYDARSLEVLATALARIPEQQAEVQSQFYHGLQQTAVAMGEQGVRVASAIAAANQTMASAELLKANTAAIQAGKPEGARIEVHQGDGHQHHEHIEQPTERMSAANYMTKVHSVIESKCVGCHSQEKPPASEAFPNGIELNEFMTFNRRQRRLVIEKIDSGEMPKGQERLSLTDRLSFYRWLEGAER